MAAILCLDENDNNASYMDTKEKRKFIKLLNIRYKCEIPNDVISRTLAEFKEF